MNGTLHARGALPPDVALRFGTALGIAPAVHARGTARLDEHVAVLVAAATALGYTGVDPEALVADVTCRVADLHDGDDGRQLVTVALVPTPPEHRAAAPGADWTVVVRGCSPPARSGPLRITVPPFRRNHRSPTANALLLDDAELAAGTRAARAGGFDDVVWPNLDDDVASIGDGACFVDLADEIVTPPLTAGPPASVWRDRAAARVGAVERELAIGELVRAGAVVCVRPWGTAEVVASIDGGADTTAAGEDLAARLAPGSGDT